MQEQDPQTPRPSSAVLTLPDADRVEFERNYITTAVCELRFPILLEYETKKPVRYDDGVSWKYQWRAPASIAQSIVFFVAASSANDDGSPFGDIIHFRSFELTAA